MDCGSIERTVRAIFRPCVTSSGRTRRKSRTQGNVAGSVPRVLTTSVRTSFHSVICIAKFARQTHSCSRMGFGPAWKVARFRMMDARSSGSCARGTWWRSYTIWPCQKRSITASQYPTLPLSVVTANSLAAGSAGCDSIIASVVVHASCCSVWSASPTFPASHYDVPTSGTAPGTGVPALSAPDCPPTASCCAPPARARSSAPHLQPWSIRFGDVVGGTGKRRAREDGDGGVRSMQRACTGDVCVGGLHAAAE
jgi:hypothetical protein